MKELVLFSFSRLSLFSLFSLRSRDPSLRPLWFSFVGMRVQTRYLG